MIFPSLEALLKYGIAWDFPQKVNFSKQHAMKAQRWSTGIALLFF
jgi:hypothetical protein